MSDCIFCKIGAGEIPAKEAYRDEAVVAIEDVNPQAPLHLLVMPLEHHRNVGLLAQDGDGALLARLMTVAARLGTQRGGDGFRLVLNTGPDGGQTVDHLHVHVLGGRRMNWPPG
ncbi:MAG TPA: histidine triad nucleotide-binding protein [Verrucomicrobiae bacterium]|nr:histidine triad nucleotide-binding protein [Verrucomicrobiae bacterium]